MNEIWREFKRDVLTEVRNPAVRGQWRLAFVLFCATVALTIVAVVI